VLHRPHLRHTRLSKRNNYASTSYILRISSSKSQSSHCSQPLVRSQSNQYQSSNMSIHRQRQLVKLTRKIESLRMRQ
jgi:hypothetical protein